MQIDRRQMLCGTIAAAIATAFPSSRVVGGPEAPEARAATDPPPMPSPGHEHLERGARDVVWVVYYGDEAWYEFILPADGETLRDVKMRHVASGQVTRGPWSR